MKIAAILFAFILILGVTGFILLNQDKVIFQTENIQPTVTPSEVLLTNEEHCKRKILSDNNLFEDRMAQAVKTCKDTQICTYQDFRTWASVNGQYVPDWRSEGYINIKTQECVENWPTETPTIIASPSAIFTP